MPRVYISSSFTDLIDYRIAARKAISALRHEPWGMEDDPASDHPTIEKCLSDVSQCDYYVGIVAWRYGSTPPGIDKSYTELEFDTAVEKGLSCLVFCYDEAQEWVGQADADRSRVEAFRNKIRNLKTIKSFRNPDELEAKVSQALHHASKDRPSNKVQLTPILPYLLDRSEQSDELKDVILNHRSNALEKPIAIAIHGDEREEHGRFIDRLEQVTLPVLLDLPADTSVKSIELLWPESSGNKTQDIARRFDRLKANLAEELTGNRQAEREEMWSAVKDFRSPVYISCSILSQEWQSHEPQLIEQWLSWWADWPGLPRGQTLIAFLSFLYADTSGQKFWVKRKLEKQIKSMQAELERLSTESPQKLVCLSRLTSLKEKHVEHWLETHVEEFIKNSSISRICDPLLLQEQLMPWVRDQFRAVEGGMIPMQALVEDLRSKVNQYLNEENS